MKVKSESELAQSCPTLSNPMDYIAFQAPPSMGFSRQEYWSGVPLPSPLLRSTTVLFKVLYCKIKKIFACVFVSYVLFVWKIL